MTETTIASDLATTYDAARAYELDRAHVFHSWSAQAEISPMVITRAEGSHVWDGAGKRYLDFSSQLVFTNLGHQHPRIVAAIQEQAGAPVHRRAGLRQRHPVGGRPPDRLAHPRRPRPRLLHQRRRRRQRARRTDGAAAHRPAQGALDLPQLPRRHAPRGEHDRRPAPLGQRPRLDRHGALLRAVPLPQRLPRDHRGGGVPARARAPRAGRRARGSRRRSPRSCSRPSPAPPGSWSRRRATSPASARSATATASCSSPTR